MVRNHFWVRRWAAASWGRRLMICCLKAAMTMVSSKSGPLMYSQSRYFSRNYWSRGSSTQQKRNTPSSRLLSCSFRVESDSRICVSIQTSLLPSRSTTRELLSIRLLMANSLRGSWLSACSSPRQQRARSSCSRRSWATLQPSFIMLSCALILSANLQKVWVVSLRSRGRCCSSCTGQAVRFLSCSRCSCRYPSATPCLFYSPTSAITIICDQKDNPRTKPTARRPLVQATHSHQRHYESLHRPPKWASIVYYFQQQNEMPKWERTGMDSFSTLTPWETECEETAINRYCSDFVEQKKPMNFPAIATKKRAASHCTPVKNENQPAAVKSVHELDPYHRAHHTITQGSNRSERPERKKCERGALQELSVKNFVIEGQQNTGKEKILRKRESSYILKQKFAEFRRSTKLFGQENNLRAVRYDN